MVYKKIWYVLGRFVIIYSDWDNVDKDQGTQLLQLLSGLPLALTQASAYIQQTGITFAQYINLYNSR